jgi:hypothetical protein
MNAEQFRREKWFYRALPVVAGVVLLWTFVLVQKLTGNNQAGVFAAFTAAFLVMWRWKVSGLRLESWTCPGCGRHLSRRMSWSFPPKKCPNCGEPTPK